MRRWIIGSLVLLTVFFVYIIFNGTPWGKENMKRESAKYLQEKYGDEMKIESVEYDFDNSSYFDFKYYTIAHLKRNPQIQFRLSRNNGEFIDNFDVTYWEHEVKSEIKDQFNQISSVMFQLMSKPLQDHSKVNGIFPSSYHDIKEKIMDKDMPDLRLRINIDDNKQENIMNTIFEIVMFLKVKDYRLSSMSIELDNQTNTESYFLKGTDLKDITDLKSLTNKLK